MKALRNVVMGVVSLLAVAGTAQATSIDLGTLSPSNPYVFSNTIVPPAGNFSQDFTFGVNFPAGSTGVLAGAAYFTWAGTFSSLDMTFNGQTYDILNNVGNGNSISFGTLTNTTQTSPYKFTVSGTAVGSSGAGFVAHISAVPLPAAAWLFGTGLIGLVGIARRRS